MTKVRKILLVELFLIFTSSTVFAQLSKPVKPQKPYDKAAPYILHNGGVAWSRVTRIQSQTECSNFVWQDDMVGAYYSLMTGNLPVNFIAKLGAYYPYHYEFRQVEQKPTQILLYSIDFNAGPYWTIPLWEVANLNLAPMVHCRYQLTDEFHHVDLGIGAYAGFEFPISKKCTVLLNGEITYDCGNLGTNSKILPYDFVYSYNVDIGFRFDSKGRNNFYYIKPKAEYEQYKIKQEEKLEEEKRKITEKQEAAAAKKEQKQQEMTEYKQAMVEYKEAMKEYQAAKKQLDEQNRQAKKEVKD